MKLDKKDVIVEFDLNTISKNKYYVKDRYYVFVGENDDVHIGRIEDSEYIKNNFKFGYKK